MIQQVFLKEGPHKTVFPTIFVKVMVVSRDIHAIANVRIKMKLSSCLLAACSTFENVYLLLTSE